MASSAANHFSGEIDGHGDSQNIRVGDELLRHAAPDLKHGDAVIAFARPHELDILPDGDAAEGVPARVSRVLSFGVTARVELDGLNGATGQHFEVELTRERVDALALQEGQAVRLQPSRLRVFAR